MKHIFITGVTKGIGNALAKRFLATGHLVTGTGRDENQLKKLNKKINSNNNSFFKTDIKDYKDVLNCCSKIVNQFSPPDIIINNAGIINQNSNLWDIDVNEFENVIKTNINGSFHIIKAFFPYIIKKKFCLIINMSSGWGRSVSPKVAPYCASKWGIEGLTKALSMELPANIAAVSINPGVVNTNMLKTCFGSSAELCQSSDDFAIKAEKIILALDINDNGKELSI